MRDVFAIGDVLNDAYEIRGVLGHGGMGQVFDAYDRHLNRNVAIKVAWPTVDGTAVRKEAEALAAIRHASMVTVYAWGVHRGTEFVVMERVGGVTLATHIQRRNAAGKPFLLGEAIEILALVAEGLAVVHRAGIAHRDVKPDNIMLAPGGRVVIMDFGVFLPEFAMGPQSSTSGSPAYMAPETISGNVGSGGGFLVDVYAFGVICFELLTGELPFPGETAREIYMGHLASEVPPVRTRRHDVLPQLDVLVSDLMIKDPGERPQSMEEVAHQLRLMLTLLQNMGKSSEGSPSSRRIPLPSSGRISSGRILVDESPASEKGERAADVRTTTRSSER